MNRMSRVASLTALVGLSAASHAFSFMINSGVQVHPHFPKIPYGSVDSKFQVRKVDHLGNTLIDWFNPFVVTPFPEGFTEHNAPWSGDDAYEPAEKRPDRPSF